MIEIKKDLYWVGIKDWELKKFHGDEFTTTQGSSYNSYVVKGGGKTVLVDTCWAPFKEEFLSHLEATVGLDKIDALICQHSESDHSGAMVALLERAPRPAGLLYGQGQANADGSIPQGMEFHHR